MNKEIILAEWQQITERLTELIASFSPEAFNRKPVENGWSAAQVAEHLLKVELSTRHALKSETIPTNRPPDEKIPLIKNAMESDTKRVAPELVKPADTWQEPQAIAEALQKQREQVKALINELDLTEACRLYKHPSLGTLTRLEWVYFNIYHAERHLRQMQQLCDTKAEA
jgi:uncharacterized damage-inducible protein DinB